MKQAMFTSLRQDWRTPKELYDKLDAEFGFNHDPCPATNYVPKVDGLISTWGEVNFVNPPYNEVAKWVQKAHEEWKLGKTSVLLIPARTDTKWFHEYILDQAEIRFIKGRLRFEGAKNVAPFPSMICLFEKGAWKGKLNVNSNKGGAL